MAEDKTRFERETKRIRIVGPDDELEILGRIIFETETAVPMVRLSFFTVVDGFPDPTCSVILSEDSVGRVDEMRYFFKGKLDCKKLQSGQECLMIMTTDKDTPPVSHSFRVLGNPSRRPACEGSWGVDLSFGTIMNQYNHNADNELAVGVSLGSEPPEGFVVTLALCIYSGGTLTTLKTYTDDTFPSNVANFTVEEEYLEPSKSYTLMATANQEHTPAMTLIATAFG